MKFGRQIKSVRKFSNKQAKMYSFGAKKIGKYGVGIGDSMTNAGAATEIVVSLWRKCEQLEQVMTSQVQLRMV